MRLIGRVGRDPLLRTTKGDTLIARFPLAVHHEDGRTEWHTIVAFNERAAKVQESVTKGQTVEVVGYIHERTRQLEGGKTKTEREIYAAVIKSPRQGR